MVFVEATLLSTRLARRDGTLVSVMEPLSLQNPLDVDLKHSRAALISEGPRLRIEAEPSGATIQGESVPFGSVWTGLGWVGPVLHVLQEPGHTLGWPPEVPAPLGPWADDVLSVLGDSLLEKGFALGSRLHARRADGVQWLSLTPLIPPMAMSVEWRRGVGDVLTLRRRGYSSGWSLSWSLGHSLASHGVLKPLRQVRVELEYDARHELIRLMAGLASGGLPCVEAVHCAFDDAPPEGLEGVTRALREMPGLRVGLPTLRRLEVTLHT